MAKEGICTHVLKVKTGQADNRAYSEYSLKTMLTDENEGTCES